MGLGPSSCNKDLNTNIERGKLRAHKQKKANLNGPETPEKGIFDPKKVISQFSTEPGPP